MLSSTVTVCERPAEPGFAIAASVPSLSITCASSQSGSGAPSSARLNGGTPASAGIEAKARPEDLALRTGTRSSVGSSSRTSSSVRNSRVPDASRALSSVASETVSSTGRTGSGASSLTPTKK